MIKYLNTSSLRSVYSNPCAKDLENILYIFQILKQLANISQIHILYNF
jgi:hypothetical protein